MPSELTNQDMTYYTPPCSPGKLKDNTEMTYILFLFKVSKYMLTWDYLYNLGGS